MTGMVQSFVHRQSAHCESGVMSSLLTHYGLPISEAMAFGLAGCLAFAYLPMFKIAGQPLISYRMPPGAIRRGLRRRIGVRMVAERFRRPADGGRRLDELLDQGFLVGLQASAFWLPYFPPEMRFHFNAHNLLVYGRKHGGYLVSDPIFEAPHFCDRADLERARFATGALASRGLLYYLTAPPLPVDYPRAIRKAIRANRRIMTGAPLPIIGLRGIRHLGRNLVAREKMDDPQRLRLFLAHLVRMQEEIGTGGAGFRYIYAYFLEQAAEICRESRFQTASEQMTAIGDEWRTFASLCVKQCKQPSENGCREIAAFLRTIADKEEALWKSLKAV